MKFESRLTDKVILTEIGSRLAKLRLSRNLTQARLAEESGVAKNTVQRLESGAAATQLSGFVRVCRVLGLVEHLEAFIPEPAVSPMAQLKLQGRKRQRATGGRAVPGKEKKWTWGEPA